MEFICYDSKRIIMIFNDIIWRGKMKDLKILTVKILNFDVEISRIHHLTHF